MARTLQPARSRLRRWMLRVVALLLLFVVAYHGWLFWEIWRLREHNPATTAFMEQGLARLQARNPRARLEHRWVPYQRISLELKRAVIAAEDQKFLDHTGFDFEEIEKAYEANEQRGRVRRGASTISQQLAKNLFLTSERSYLRKLREAAITAMIEAALPKRRVLEIYLNVIEWGDGIYGAEAAAQRFFGKSAAELDAEEGAQLAARIPNPRFYHRRGVTPYLERRTADLLEQMERVRVP
jgi:monofunctional biosynthetic peptidoglycan transglycosylase